MAATEIKPVEKPRRILGVPDIGHFVPRSQTAEVARQLCAANVADAANEAAASVIGVFSAAALVGAGGFGKSVTAIMACHDPRVLQHFTAGIVWLTCGQEVSVDGKRVRGKQHMADAQTKEHGSEDSSLGVAHVVNEC